MHAHTGVGIPNALSQRRVRFAGFRGRIFAFRFLRGAVSLRRSDRVSVHGVTSYAAATVQIASRFTRWRARFTCHALSFRGRPSFFPRFLAAANPSFVLTEMTRRSIRPQAAITV